MAAPAWGAKPAVVAGDWAEDVEAEEQELGEIQVCVPGFVCFCGVAGRALVSRPRLPACNAYLPVLPRSSYYHIV
jgi:hypothetical protein